MLAIGCGDREHEPWLTTFLSPEKIDVDAYVARLSAAATGWTVVGPDALEEADALVVELTEVDRALLDRAPRLRKVLHFGSLLDRVDCDACAARNVEVVPIHRRTTANVADHTLLLVLALVRRLEADARLHTDDLPGAVASSTEKGGHASTVFNWKGIAGLRALEEMRLATLGGGEIAYAVARRARAFGMEVGYWARHWRPPLEELGVRRLSFEQVPIWADVVSVQLTYAPELLHIVDADFLERLGSGAYLVNTSRGLLVDLDALLAALRGGAIAGAALDVFPEEPPTRTEELLSTPNLIATPHVGAGSRWAVLTDVEAIGRALSAGVAA